MIWKDQALTVLPLASCACPGRPAATAAAAVARGVPPANLRRVELTWRADHYELCLTLDTGETLPPPLPAGAVAGVDLGEVHIAAVTTTQSACAGSVGTAAAACKQWRNKVHSVLQEKLSRCQPGSRRAKRLSRRKAKVSAKLYRQQRDLLHQAARKVVDFCQIEGVSGSR